MKTKKIIIPNDFSAHTLLLLRMAIELHPEEKLDIVLLHGIHLSDSITDLIFFKKEKYLQELCTKDFDDACMLIKNTFQSRIVSLYLDLITSNNHAYFRNYLEGNEITEAYLPADHELKFTGKRSFDIVPLLKKSTIPVKSIQLYTRNEMQSLDTHGVAALFHPGLLKN